jgi:single-strand DNA-binding protein
MNLNKVFILGNITRDPEMRAMPSGQQVASFGMATNRFYTDASGQKKQDAEFHNIVCFGKLADTASRYLTKGGLVMIEGRIKTSSWQGNDGIKKYKTEIIAESLQLGPRMAGTPGTAPSGNYQKPQANFAKNVDTNEIPIIEENYTPPSSIHEDGDIDVKDIPF